MTATQHPLWRKFLDFDKKRHCGQPDLSDQSDIEAWEAFLAGAEASGAPELLAALEMMGETGNTASRAKGEA